MKKHTLEQRLNSIHRNTLLSFLLAPTIQQFRLELIHLRLRLSLLASDRGDFVLGIVEEFVVFCHVEDDFFPLVFVSAAVEQREFLFVFFFRDPVVGDLVEVFEEPRPVWVVALLAAEDIDTGDGHSGHLVAAGGVDVV